MQNADPEHVYGVYQAFLDTLGQDKAFVYAGAAGSSAIFAKTGTGWATLLQKLHVWRLNLMAFFNRD
jgi:hypothetical protein